MARIHPKLLINNNGRIRLAANSKPAVGIMPITVEECNLLTPITVGPAGYQYDTRRITGLPFAQIWRRDASMWGHILAFDKIPGPIGVSGISFSTQGKGKGACCVDSCKPMLTFSFKLAQTSWRLLPSRGPARLLPCQCRLLPPNHSGLIPRIRISCPLTTQVRSAII